MNSKNAGATLEQSGTSTESASRLLCSAAVVANQRWWPALVLALLTAAMAAIALLSHQLSISRADKVAPSEGFYGSVAQYQVAHHRLKQELRAIAAGETPNAEALARSAAVLASRASILTEPSEVKALMSRVRGYAEATEHVAQLQRRIGPILEVNGFAQADAVKVLGEFKAIDDDELLNQLASNARLAEVASREELVNNLDRRLRWAWTGLAVGWSTLVLWLIYVVRSRRRYAAAARDRQLAVEAMEQAISSKHKFLSMVSHELRSPLQSIVTSLETLSIDPSLAGRPPSAAAVRRIRHAVSAMQGQFRDLLTIARSDASQPGIQVDTFEIGELVHDVCADFRDSATAKGLALRVSGPAFTISADPIRIAQVLRNLVENAVRYTHAGYVEVSVEHFMSGVSAAMRVPSETALRSAAAPDSSATAGWVRFAVHDTGPGLPAIAANRLKNAAVPFASSSEGTGIGLFVIRDVLEQLGGSIDVQTREATDPEGRGTTFTVTIPAIQVHAPAALDSDREPAELMRILIVDDLPDVRSALSEVTGRLGHSCIAVASAAEARPLLASERFDVILIDLEMPDTDGLALAAEIRQGGGRHTATLLVLISAAENQAVGHAWPFDGFLQKPIDAAALRRVIGSRT